MQVGRKTDRKDGAISWEFDYIKQKIRCPKKAANLLFSQRFKTYAAARSRASLLRMKIFLISMTKNGALDMLSIINQ